MTQSLAVFNELLAQKKEEKEQVEAHKEELQLEIKHVNEEVFAHKAI